MEIQSVKKTMNILSILSNNKNKPVSVSAISKITGFNKSTCMHILSTLMSDGYVKKVSHSQGYILGPSTYLLTRYGRYDEDFISICRPVIRWLFNKINCTIILATLQSNQKFVIDYIDEKGILTYGNSSKIFNDDIYRTATGRAMLAHSDRDVVENFYKKHGKPLSEHWSEVNSYESLCEELDKIKKTSVVKTEMVNPDKTISIGYAQTLFKGISCIGSIGVAIKCQKDEYDEYVKRDTIIKKRLSQATNEINRRLAYTV